MATSISTMKIPAELLHTKRCHSPTRGLCLPSTKDKDFCVLNWNVSLHPLIGHYVASQRDGIITFGWYHPAHLLYQDQYSFQFVNLTILGHDWIYLNIILLNTFTPAWPIWIHQSIIIVTTLQPISTQFSQEWVCRKVVIKHSINQIKPANIMISYLISGFLMPSFVKLGVSVLVICMALLLLGRVGPYYC